MKPNLLHKSFLIICALIITAFGSARAQVTNSTWIGQTGDHWSDASKWDPGIVPNNDGLHAFDVIIADGADFPGIDVDQNVTLSSLTCTGDFAGFTLTDHNLTSTATSIGVNYPNEKYGGGVVYAFAQNISVIANLGNLADFSGTTLNTGNYVADASFAPAGATATIQFNGADIRTTNGYLGLNGPGSRFVDELGHDAVANLQHILVDNGVFDIETGRSFTTASSLVNEGEVRVISAFGGADASSTLTVTGNYTGIGYPLDPGTLGLTILLAAGPLGDAKLVINGTLTNYDPATKTLHKMYHNFEAANGRSATTQVLGGNQLLDIVTSEASLILFGPNTGFRDKIGNDALRNLVVSARMQVGDRDFDTASSFTSTSRLTILGDTRFTTNGDLTIKGGFFELSPLTGYAAAGEDSFPVDPRYVASTIHVKGNLNLLSGTEFRLHIVDNPTLPTITVDGNANLAGTFALFIDSKNITKTDSFTVMTAAHIAGQFDNVPSGGRVAAISGPAVAGTFLATYAGSSFVVGDFQPHASMQNISTRLKIASSDNVSIAGFIVRGKGPKQVMVRGIGPSLASKGVPGALVDPTLELLDSSNATLATNNDWQQTQSQEISATGIAPTDPHESAIIAALDPGMYTAVLRGANNTGGIGLIEVYDLDPDPASSEFANVSSRGLAGINDEVMIGGYIIGTGNPANLIVRAIGPSLTAKGVAGALQDPTLELHDGSGAKIASNDNWQDDASQASQITTAGLAPTDARESALFATLAPGNYTAIVRGKNNTQGIGLVEFYKLN